MNVSVVIPTCDRVEQLRACLSRLMDGMQEIDDDVCEIIVSDDGRINMAKDFLAADFPRVLWIQGPRKGPAANRNCGAASASGVLIAFLDDDCLPESGWLHEFIDAFKKSRSPVLEGRTYADRPRRSLSEESPINENGGCLWSCNFAITREKFMQLGGFDDRFPYPAFEDIDFYTRCLAAGLRVEFVREAAVCHPWRSGMTWHVIRRRFESLRFFMDKHPEATHFRSARFWLGSIVRLLVVEALYKGFIYHGRGAWYPIAKAIFQLDMLRRLILTRLGRRAGPIQQGQSDHFRT